MTTTEAPTTQQLLTHAPACPMCALIVDTYAWQLDVAMRTPGALVHCGAAMSWIGYSPRVVSTGDVLCGFHAALCGKEKLHA